MTPRVAQEFAKVTGLAASIGAAVSIAWWFDPSFADATGVAVMLVGGGFTLAGLVLVLRTARGGGRGFAREMPALWAVRSRILRRWLTLVAAAAVISASVAAIDSRGYSQHPPGTLAQCKWSIVKDHGQTNVCVSHDRWLATGEDFQRMFVGVVVLLLAFECSSFTFISLPEQPRTDGAIKNFS